ncbi:hypothetical protein [Paenibacillus planticolens]|uniref:hypothetical protein n=1 Tax=Paenibacillus planticolens TaxID=2654976 RepID=UPI001490DD2D|nr:hypothetical protein [Paenibacillus planticolens]
MEYLLTFSETEFDGGSYERWCPNEIVDFWSIPYEERVIIQAPLGLSFGDMGKIYFFICKKCDSKKVKTIFQCS